MNRSWYIYYGHKLGMTKEEVLRTRFGEMQDLLACMAIENGGADQVIKRRMNFAEVMELK